MQRGRAELTLRGARRCSRAGDRELRLDADTTNIAALYAPQAREAEELPAASYQLPATSYQL